MKLKEGVKIVVGKKTFKGEISEKDVKRHGLEIDPDLLEKPEEPEKPSDNKGKKDK